MIYQTHKTFNLKISNPTIKFIQPNRLYQTHFGCSIDEQGTVNIWNTELILKRMSICDFKLAFKYPSNLFEDWLRNDV